MSCIALPRTIHARTKQSRATARDLSAVRRPMNPPAGPARTSGLVVPTSCCRPDRRDLDGKAKVLDAADEAKDLLAFRTAVEVVAAEVLVQSAVLQHVVRSGENRWSDGADRFLRSSSGSHTLELGLKVAALGP